MNLSLLLLVAVVLPSKSAWGKVQRVTRQVLANGLPLGNRRRNRNVVVPGLKFIKRDSDVPMGDTAEFTMYDTDWETELGPLDVKVEFGDYVADAKAYALPGPRGRFVMINTDRCAEEEG